jgi:cobalt-zinc-cadmium efflux system protein
MSHCHASEEHCHCQHSHEADQHDRGAESTPHHHRHGGHHHAHGTTPLLWTIVMNVVITLAEFIGGFWSGSLALISDALHNFSDVFALILSLIGLKLEHKPATLTMSYGYRRAEIIVAFINGFSLIFIAGYIFIESWRRFQHPAPIAIGTVMIVSAITIAANAFSAYLLFKDKDTNLNIRSSFLHLLYDAISSVGVFLASIIIYFTQWYIVDVVMSVAIGLMILIGSGRLVLDGLHIIMEGVPKNLNIAEVARCIESNERIIGVHDLHIWSISSSYLSLSGHVHIHSEDITRFDLIVGELSQQLQHQFNISHVTLQPETRECEMAKKICCG